MLKKSLLFILSCIATGAFAQYDTVHFRFDIQKLKSFTYKLVTTEYLENENSYVLNMDQDTAFLKFTPGIRTGELLPVKLEYRRREDKPASVLPFDQPERNLIYELSFDTSGHLISLNNWTKFRALYLKSLQESLNSKELSREQYEDLTVYYNNQQNIESEILRDLFYLFQFADNTYVTNNRYILQKNLIDPFNNERYPVQSAFVVQKPFGSNYTFNGAAAFETGESEQTKMIDHFNVINGGPEKALEPLLEAQIKSDIKCFYNHSRKIFTGYNQTDVVVLNDKRKVRRIQFTLLETD